MQLNLLLYSKHGEYAYNEVTIEIDPILTSVDNEIYDTVGIDTLAFDLDSRLDILVFEANLPYELEN